MNTNTAVIGGVVIVLLLIGGIFLYTQNNTTGTTATSTPSSTDNSDTTPQTRTQGSPVATTNSNVNPTATTAVVVGGVVPNGAATSYWYEYGASSNLGITTAKQNIGSGYANLAAPTYITQLAKDTTYYFRLVAQNSFGKSTGATYTFHTTVGIPAPTGSTPTLKTLAASGVSRTAANLQGEVTPNQAPTIYWFEYGGSVNLGEVSPAQSIGDGTTKVPASFSLPNLVPATTYYFRLNAQNNFGTVNGAILNFKTAGPALSGAPVVVTLVTVPATTTATLRGTVNPNDAQTTYWFEYGTDAGFGSATVTTDHKSLGAGANTLSVETPITNLRSNTTYYFRMVAQNSAGTTNGDRQTFKTN
ncbi:hypothetical protein EXS62_02810 [Candidatus Kaiserbacteria bacterium]|nr:hypothetical protein [Candidatus Kaiserbacteria bacterium]